MCDQAKESRRLVLVCCGTFSPPTVMHLRIMAMAEEHCRRLFPHCTITKCYYSAVHDAYGKRGRVGFEHRTQMLRLAVQDARADYVVDDWEPRQPHWTRTADVLDRFAALHPDADRVMLVSSTDLLPGLHVPDLWTLDDISRLLSDMRGILAVERVPDVPLSRCFEHIVRRPAVYERQRHLYLVPQPCAFDVSSTKVRQLLHSGGCIVGLVSASVEAYIREHQLYGNPDQEP